MKLTLRKANALQLQINEQLSATQLELMRGYTENL